MTFTIGLHQGSTDVLGHQSAGRTTKVAVGCVSRYVVASED